MLIPGAGAVVQALPYLDVLAGVHRGFVPVAPGQSPDIRPEESVNYEAGARYLGSFANAEVIGFFSDYSNLKDMCAASRGCTEDQIGTEFNGGAVHVYGVEAQATAEVALPRRLRMPLKASYTLNRSRFQSDLMSTNPQWGEVLAGDELPYMPVHQLSVHAGVGGAGAAAGSSWEVAVAGRYSSAMRDTAGQGLAAPGERTDATVVLDVAANYDLGGWGKAYVTVDNVLDEAHIVSRRPYGARPGKPRLVTVGYKNRF
jgi:Fe(3+) dicitrate transport protein